MKTLEFLIPSAVKGKAASVRRLERPESQVCPRHVIPVMAIDRCVCSPPEVKHGPFCSVLYRYARTKQDGTLQYVRNV